MLHLGNKKKLGPLRLPNHLYLSSFVKYTITLVHSFKDEVNRVTRSDLLLPNRWSLPHIDAHLGRRVSSPPPSRDPRSLEILKNLEFSIFLKLLKMVLRVIRDTQGRRTGPGKTSGDLSKHHSNRFRGRAVALSGPEQPPNRLVKFKIFIKF